MVCAQQADRHDPEAIPIAWRYQFNNKEVLDGTGQKLAKYPAKKPICKS